jgi:hypothetical protein
VFETLRSSTSFSASHCHSTTCDTAVLELIPPASTLGDI